MGFETHDDAGAYQIRDDLALVQTVDFFTPIVDDPFDFGQIAAANALSDAYAMGARPITALNIVGFPASQLPMTVLAAILQGGAAKAKEAGVALLGGHSVKDPELKYGMSVTALAHPSRIIRNSTARVGDQLILTKALGTGILTTALKRSLIQESDFAQAVASMKRLNRFAAEVMLAHHVSAATDVTGFSLIGHLHEICQGSGVRAQIDLAAIPLLDHALALVEQGVMLGGLRDNQRFFGTQAPHDPAIPTALYDILFDPQTSGGLLFALPPHAATDALAALHQGDAPESAIIGQILPPDQEKPLISFLI